MTVSTLVGLSVATAYLLVVVLGSCSNALVLLTYFMWRGAITIQPKDVFILSLAAGDFLMAACVAPFGLASGIARRWTTGHFGCQYYGFFSSWIGLASITQLSIHAIERYITLASPIPNIISVKMACLMVFASWLAGFLASAFPLFGWSSYTLEGYGLHCAILWDSTAVGDVSYSFFLIALFFLLPTGVIVFSFVRIYFIVRRMYLSAGLTWGADAQVTKDSYEAQVKTTKQLFFMISGFIFAWTPYTIMSAMVAFFGSDIPLVYHEYPSLFAKTSTFYNPMIYFFTYPSLRKKAINLLRRKPETNAVQPHV